MQPAIVAVVADDLRYERISRLIGGLGVELSSFDSLDQLIRASSPLPAVVLLWSEESKRSPVEQLELLGQHVQQASVVLVCAELPRWQARRALAGGVAGIVFEDEMEATLGPCVRAVLVGQICVPPRHREQIEPPVLSAREKQVLGLVVMGYMNGQIAQQLFLAESTVKSHLSSAFAKLGVRSRNEAVELIVDPDQGLGTGILALGGAPLAPVSALGASEPDSTDSSASLHGGIRSI